MKKEKKESVSTEENCKQVFCWRKLSMTRTTRIKKLNSWKKADKTADQIRQLTRKDMLKKWKTMRHH